MAVIGRQIGNRPKEMDSGQGHPDELGSGRWWQDGGQSSAKGLYFALQ
jgi:hypothetical protein